MYLDPKKIIPGPWRDVTGDKERDALICAMTALEEREGERLGWKKRPTLWLMWLPASGGNQVLAGRLTPMVWHTGTRNPVDDLVTTAYRQPPPQRDTPRMSFADSPDGLAAVAFMTEAWGAPLDTLTDEQRAANAAGKRIMHQAEQRQEMRTITAVDINGYGYGMARISGQPLAPDVTLSEPADIWLPGGHGAGRLPRALFCLARAALVHGWPANHKVS